MKLFVDGRKNTLTSLSSIDFSKNEWLWFHCASLGEYEQAVPLIEELKNKKYKILVSFFSPSGYEQKKNHKLIDVAIYLPIDTPSNAEYLVKTVQPKQAFFVKYEFWRNYFSALSKREIPIYMISSTFRANQVFFKWYGSFYKQTLKMVNHFFVQHVNSQQVLIANGFENVTVSGDTRFDRVYAQLKMNNQLDFIADFKANRTCVVLGSTWPDCEAVFLKAINASNEDVCFVIAPHEIRPEKINSLVEKLKVNTSVFTKGIDNQSKVLIVDAVGYLTRIYSYADVAYVGGAVGITGLHNILEPAVFGMPILAGTNTRKFPEADALQNAGGLVKINTADEFEIILNDLLENESKRNDIGEASKNFIKNQTGATEKIIAFLN